MTRPAPGLLSVRISYHPPALFLYFSLLNAFLAFGPFGLAAKVFIGLVALLGPFLFFSFTLRPAAQFREKPMASAPGPGMIWLVLALGLSLRLCVCLGLPVWPMWDDGIHSLLSYQQSRHWTWHLWYSNEKLGPLSFWAKALWFKLIPPSLFSIWALQALESLWLWWRAFGPAGNGFRAASPSFTFASWPWAFGPFMWAYFQGPKPAWSFSNFYPWAFGVHPTPSPRDFPKQAGSGVGVGLKGFVAMFQS